MARREKKALTHHPTRRAPRIFTSSDSLILNHTFPAKASVSVAILGVPD